MGGYPPHTPRRETRGFGENNNFCNRLGVNDILQFENSVATECKNCLLLTGLVKKVNSKLSLSLGCKKLKCKALKFGTCKLNLGCWALEIWGLEIGPWKLGLGNWALEIGPWKQEYLADLYPCKSIHLEIIPLENIHPWKYNPLE